MQNLLRSTAIKLMAILIIPSGLIGLSATASSASTKSSAVEAKTIGVMPASEQSEYLQQEVEELKQTVQPLGWKVVEIDGQATPSDMETGMSTFVAEKVNAIFTLSIGGSEIPQGLAAAKAAGIPVFGMITQVQPNQEQNFAGEYADTNTGTGKLVGEYICSHLKSDKVVGEEITANYAGQSFVVGVEAGLKTCGKSYSELQNTDLTGWPQDMAPTAAAELTQNQGPLVLVDYSDAGSQIILPVIQQAGRTNVKLLTRYNDASTIKLMRSGAAIDTVVTKGYQHIFDAVSVLLAHWSSGKALSNTPSVNLGDAKVITATNLPAGTTNEIYPFTKDLSAQLAQWKKTYGL